MNTTDNVDDAVSWTVGVLLPADWCSASQHPADSPESILCAQFVVLQR